MVGVRLRLSVQKRFRLSCLGREDAADLKLLIAGIEALFKLGVLHFAVLDALKTPNSSFLTPDRVRFSFSFNKTESHPALTAGNRTRMMWPFSGREEKPGRPFFRGES